MNLLFQESNIFFQEGNLLCERYSMVCAPVRRDNPRGDNRLTGAQTMFYLTCTTITSVDLAHYGISRAKDRASVDCGTIQIMIL